MTDNDKERGKRLGVVVVAGENIEKLFTGKLTIMEGLPDDATLYDTWEEPRKSTYNFAFQSDEFCVVPEGEEYQKWMFCRTTSCK